MPPFEKQQDEKVQAGHAVGQEGRAARARGPHIQPPWQDKYRVKQDIQQAAAHGAQAGVKGRALRPHQIGHHHVQNRRGRAKEHGPLHVARCGLHGICRGAQQPQKRLPEGKAQQGKQDAAEDGAIKPEGRACIDRVKVLPPQRPAHHAGAAHAEQVVDGVEGQQHRRRQRNRRILNRVVQHPDKVGVGQVVKDHNQGAQNRRHRQLHHSLGYRNLLKERKTLFIFHPMCPPLRAIRACRGLQALG